MTYCFGDDLPIEAYWPCWPNDPVPDDLMTLVNLLT
jgi:hypothetical protein